MAKITVQALGWHEDELTFGAVRRLSRARRVILRTRRCGAADYLEREGIPFDSLDDIYETAEDFDQLNAEIINRLLKEADEGDLIYGVPDPGDRTVQTLLSVMGDDLILYGGAVVGSELQYYTGGTHLQFNAADYDLVRLDPCQSVLIREIDDRLLASDLKLKLMTCYPAESAVLITHPTRGIKRIQLCDLDRMAAYDHRVCAYISGAEGFAERERFSFYDLVDMTRIVCRGSDSDPVMNDSDSDDTEKRIDELAGQLQRIVLISQTASQEGCFDLSDVITVSCRATIHRHPELIRTDGKK